MAQVIRLEDAQFARAKAGSRSPNARVDQFGRAPPPVTGQQSARREDIFRAILLLDLAAQHARLLVKETSDPSRREIFEAQISTIEQLLQLARDMALKL
ncbi:MAG: hypothetical protein K2X57_28440 [Xanthobacteraceae bacterium]|nr:hypothetical protein [Xanthobacteraceae bacterium]